MSRSELDFDDEVNAQVRDLHGLRTQREAVDLALGRLPTVPFTREESLAVEGSGWGGDLDALREGTGAASR